MPTLAGGLLVALLSLSTAVAQDTSDLSSAKDLTADIFANTKRNQRAISDSWSDVLILGYAKSERLKTMNAGWLPQLMPAVDGLNAKIDAFGGGANHTNGFYGTSGSVSFPLAYQWGAQIDGGLASASGSGVADGAAHVFWRDPSIGLLGAYGSYERWNGTDLQNIGGISATTGRIAAEGEYYWGRWNFNGLAGVETVGINEPVPPASIPNRSFSVPDRFFDSISASYFVTDNFSLSIGHLYTFGTHFVTLEASMVLRSAVGGWPHRLPRA